MRGTAVLITCMALLGLPEAANADCLGGSSSAFVQIFSGGNHSCGLTAEGVAYCWGEDSYGQLGDGGTSVHSQLPVPVDAGPISGEKAFTALAVGLAHTCGLTSQGVAYCWGDDAGGQLGDGGISQESQSPVAVDTSAVIGEKAFVQLAGGGGHTCGLTSDGRGFCWGSDLSGELGDGGTSQNSQSPVAVDTASITGSQSFVSLTAGGAHTCGLTADGAAYCWGNDNNGQLGDGGTPLNAQSPSAVDRTSIPGSQVFVALVAGSAHTCGLTAGGVVYCWGSDSDGQLGDGGALQDSTTPVAVDTSLITGEKSFVQLGAGSAYTCGITAEGQTYCWGQDWYGQLGDGGDAQSSQVPVPVDTIPIAGEKEFVQLAGGFEHSCGLTAEGVAYCWGRDVNGRLGDGGTSQDSQSPVTVDTSNVVGDRVFARIMAGYYHGCGVTAEGGAYCWGSDTYGGIGDGGISENARVPVSVDTTGMGGARAFVQVVGGGWHTCGLTAEGRAYCWGSDGSGQLGDGGASSDSQSPAAVDTSGIIGEKAWVMLSAGNTFTCGLIAAGVAYCWGRDEFGQLGDGGATQDSQSPVAVDTSGLAGERAFVVISTGDEHACGLTSEGVAYCWGSDVQGQLGEGDFRQDSQFPVPVDTSPITGEKTFKALYAGGYSTCGITAEGTVYCWGDDLLGQLGDGGASQNSGVPVAVDTSGMAGARTFVRLSGGTGHTCGFTAEGRAFCWGLDSYGQLGDGGSAQNSQSPVAVDVTGIAGETAIGALVAGARHTCGLTAEGGAYCWGGDAEGQLGDDVLAVSKQSPVPVARCPVTCAVNEDCPRCMECSAPDCVNQAAGSDLKNECPVGDCLTGSCDGSGACGHQPNGNACGDQAESACDHPDTCLAGSCRDNFEPPGTSCADALFCNGDETCDGAGACQAGSDPCSPQPCDEVTDSCTCTPIGPDDPTCDSVDDDCDGTTDEDYVSVCGLGECINTGSCVDGVEVPCVPLDPPSPDDICGDGLDNNCDGTTDEGCYAPPEAVLEIQPDRGPVELAVLFDGSGSQAFGGLAISSFRWDPGDGSPWKYGVHVGHTYLLPGTYMVELLVTDEAGGTDTAKGAVSVWNMENQVPPVARIVASATEGEGLLDVQFSCDCTWGGAPIDAYLWDFGDGTMSVEPQAENLFGVGRYRVKLTVVDANGLPGTDFVEIVVSEPGKTPPQCKSSVVPTGGTAPLNAAYTGFYADLDGQVDEVKWEFADGTHLYGDLVMKEYRDPGIFNTRLTVTDNDGLSCYDSVEVAVSAAPGEVPPAIISIGNPEARCKEDYQYDQDGKPTARGSRPVEWSLGKEIGGEVVGVPEGMSINPLDGTISWVPSPRQAGPNPVTIVVSSRAGSDMQELSVEVVCDQKEEPGGCGCASTPGGETFFFSLALYLAILGKRRRAQS